MKKCCSDDDEHASWGVSAWKSHLWQSIHKLSEGQSYENDEKKHKINNKGLVGFRYVLNVYNI